MTDLYTFTPLGKAILKLFNQLEAQIKQRYPDLPDGYVKVYIFGGAAVHLYTNLRMSHDIDAEFTCYLEIDTDIIVRYQDESGSQETVTFDANYNVTLGLMHPDYHESAHPLQILANSPLWIYVASPLDLAISKVARFQEVDKQDILALANQGLIQPDEFDKRLDEALDYSATQNVLLKYNLQEAKQLVKKYASHSIRNFAKNI
jgi:hypothetical protein